jgi:hypothetical protein
MASDMKRTLKWIIVVGIAFFSSVATASQTGDAPKPRAPAQVTAARRWTWGVGSGISPFSVRAPAKTGKPWWSQKNGPVARFVTKAVAKTVKNPLRRPTP